MPIPPVRESGGIVQTTDSSTTTAEGWWQEEPVWISDRVDILELEWVCFVLYAFVGVLGFLLLLRTPRHRQGKGEGKALGARPFLPAFSLQKAWDRLPKRTPTHPSPGPLAMTSRSFPRILLSVLLGIVLCASPRSFIFSVTSPRRGKTAIARRASGIMGGFDALKKDQEEEDQYQQAGAAEERVGKFDNSDMDQYMDKDFEETDLEEYAQQFAKEEAADTSARQIRYELYPSKQYVLYLAKKNAIKTWTSDGPDGKNRGCLEVQIAIATEKIRNMILHMREFRRDYKCRLKLTSLVCARRRMLDKLASRNLDSYMKIREELKIRHVYRIEALKNRLGAYMYPIKDPFNDLFFWDRPGRPGRKTLNRLKKAKQLMTRRLANQLRQGREHKIIHRTQKKLNFRRWLVRPYDEVKAFEKNKELGKYVDPLNLPRMRRFLAMGMFAASIARCLSLLMEIEHQEGHLSFLQELGPRQVQWLWDLISLLPAVAFMSAFSVVVSFMAQLHYIMSVVSLPLLDCFVVWLNVACYFLVLAVAVGTYLLCAYEHLRAYLSCLIGFLYATLSWSLMYYGIMIMNQLGDALRKGHPAQLPVLRVLLVSVFCPLTLLIRAVCMLCWGCSMASPSTSVDLILCLCSEWLPAVVMELALIPAHTFVMAEDGGKQMTLTFLLLYRED
eukprot:s77_g9.t1